MGFTKVNVLLNERIHFENKIEFDPLGISILILGVGGVSLKRFIDGGVQGLGVCIVQQQKVSSSMNKWLDMESSAYHFHSRPRLFAVMDLQDWPQH